MVQNYYWQHALSTLAFSFVIKLGFCIGTEKLFLFRMASSESYGRWGYLPDVNPVIEVTFDMSSIDYMVFCFDTREF